MSNINSILISGALLVAASVLPACYAEATPDAAYVEAPAPVADISTYPTYEYQGQPVYLVNDHWYTRRGDHWAYYREEPAELHQRRYVQAAPPARHREHVREERPAEARPAEAPRAHRVD